MGTYLLVFSRYFQLVANGRTFVSPHFACLNLLVRLQSAKFTTSIPIGGPLRTVVESHMCTQGLAPRHKSSCGTIEAACQPEERVRSSQLAAGCFLAKPSPTVHVPWCAGGESSA